MEEDHPEDVELDLTDANVVTKFRTASDIANRIRYAKLYFNDIFRGNH
jgi:hypothetical protein